jgi:single-stranded DNA-binding protein
MAKRNLLKAPVNDSGAVEDQLEARVVEAPNHIRTRAEVFRVMPMKTLETPRDKGKIVTSVDFKASEVAINGEKVDPSEHPFHRVDFWGVRAVEAEKLVVGSVVDIEGSHVVRSYKGNDGKQHESSEIRNTDAVPLKLDVLSVPELKEIKGPVAYIPELRMAPNKKFYVQVVVDPSEGPRHTATFFGAEAERVARNISKGDTISLRGQQVEREWEGRNGPQRGFELKNPGYEILSKAQTRSMEQSLSK